uniref:Piwi domain-containing protein n=1 Tax=Caenorhabditis japonica TaxID=281687 RepID=A0A8R1DKJ2_CAEJA
MEFEVQARIDDFIAHTGRRPKHIVVYRDGICEGDFQRILYEERIAIEEAYKKTNPKGELDVTLTYIVVSKRHHTKFFPKDLSKVHEEHMFNVKPGTLVEDVVTTEKYYDFYLTTQVGMLGTSRPTHYYVLHDTWAPMISFWPTITHALTYTFCRATTTIALPSPVIYAHLAAKRAKETLNAQSARDWSMNVVFERILDKKNWKK